MEQCQITKVCMFVYHIHFKYKILSAGHKPPFGKTYIYITKQTSDDRKVNPIVTGTPKVQTSYHNICIYNITIYQNTLHTKLRL